MARGRVRDDAARVRVLEAAFELVGAEGLTSVGIDAIAAEAGVAKQTIYRWWPSKTAVILDALVVGTMKETPFPDSGDLRADIERHLRAVIALFRSPTGNLIRSLLASAQNDEAIAEEFRRRFWRPRRDLSRARLDAAIARGEVRPDIAVETVLDALYGPVWLRLMIGHRPLRPRDAADVVDAVWDGIAA